MPVLLQLSFTAFDGEAANSLEIDAGEDSDTKPGRYVFVRVDFDKTLLGERPIKPVEPVKSARLIELEEQEKSEGSNASKDVTTDEQSNDVESTADESADDEEVASEKAKDTKSPEQLELERLRNDFKSAKSKYDSDLVSYEQYSSKVESGKTKAEDLNRRFAKWFYVISGESFDKLALDRSSFVSVKATEKVDENVADEKSSGEDLPQEDKPEPDK